MKRLSRCVACGAEGWSIAEVRNGYELATCRDCGLLFTLNPDYKAERYLAAYEGSGGDPLLADGYAHVYAGPQYRLEMESAAYFCPPPRLTRAQRIALQWLKSNAPRSGVVAECGCGTGRFMHALKRAKLPAVGVELSAVTVGLLQSAGLRAIQGAAPDFPWEGPPPFAITFFEVLEHLPEPRQIIEPLKQRFPNAAILASVPAPNRWPPGDKGPTDSPPHHYLGWTPKAFERFFGSLGYSRVKVHVPKPAGYEQMPSCGAALARFKSLKRFGGELPASRPEPKVAVAAGSDRAAVNRSLTATCKVWALAGYHFAIDIWGTPAARRAERAGYSAASILVIAQP